MKINILNLKEKIYEQGWIEANYQNHNILVYGLNESRGDLCCSLQELFSKELQIKISDKMIDDCFRLGKIKNRRPVLTKFTSKLIRDCVLERSKLLKGTGIYLERDHDKLTREIRRQLVPFMKEARCKGKHVVLRDDKLIVEGRKLDLNLCKKNLGKQRSEEPVDQPGEGRGEIVTIAEGGQSSNNERRSIHTSDDVSDISLQLGEMVMMAEEGQRCNNECEGNTHK